MFLILLSILVALSVYLALPAAARLRHSRIALQVSSSLSTVQARVSAAQGAEFALHAWLLLAALAAGSLGLWLSGSWVFFFIAACGALSLPWAYARYLETKRRARFAAQLPGVLDLIAGALRSGSSLAQALQAAGQESPWPAREHFSFLAQQLQWGNEPETLLDALALEYQGSTIAEELRMLATTVAVTRTTGGNLAELLGGLAETLRERQRLRAEIDSMTAQGRLSGLIVGALPFILLLALSFLDPTLVAPMFHSGTGILLLALGLLLELIGAVLIRRIVEIDV